MTDVDTPAKDPSPTPEQSGTPGDRPDQKGTLTPAASPANPATGGAGAAGAGGADGFGTGT